MNLKIKALGLTLVAALAVSAVMASAASAAEFHAAQAHTTLSGEQTAGGSHSFTPGPGFAAVTCSTVKFAGTTTATTETSWVLTPEYKGCKDSLGRTAHVTVAAKYRLTPPASATAASNFHIGGGLTIEITNGSGVSICDVLVFSQAVNNAVYHNVTNGDIEITTTTNNITTETSGGVVNCGISDGHHASGSYTGTTIVRGTDTAGSNVDISSAAFPMQFHAGEAHTLLSGEQIGNHSFTTGAGFGAITCSIAKFAGTTTTTTETSQVLTPEYSGCKDSFGRTVHVATAAKYRFTPPSSATGTSLVHIEGSFTITITNGSGVVICTAKIGSQTGNNIAYHNVANGDIERTIATNNVTSETSGGFFNCGVTDGHHTGGTYTGNTIIRGTNTAGANVNITVS